MLALTTTTPLLALLLSLTLTLTLLPSPSVALTRWEPPTGLAYLSAWLDTADPKDSPSGGDSPTRFNERIGRRAAAFQLAQEMPVFVDQYGYKRNADLNWIQATGSDAIMFLTVYPRNANEAANAPADALDLQQKDLDELVNQLVALTDPWNGSSRRVMLRFAPEMNGYWFKAYSQRPTAWKNAYRRIVDAVRARTNRVAFVWSPNAANGYPFGSTNGIPGAEMSALDTNGDGRLTLADDPFGPYWPGEDYVDWVGISLYWKGSDGVTANDVPPADYFEQLIFGSDTFKVNRTFSLYRDYCERFNKPMVISEGNAAFHTTLVPTTGTPTPLPTGAGHLALARAFWRSAITNASFLSRFPRVKMFNLFEYIKVAEDADPATRTPGVTRDYRISADNALLTAFKEDLAGVANRFAWAGDMRWGVDPLQLVPSTNGTLVGCGPPLHLATLLISLNAQSDAPNWSALAAAVNAAHATTYTPDQARAQIRSLFGHNRASPDDKESNDPSSSDTTWTSRRLNRPRHTPPPPLHPRAPRPTAAPGPPG
ncbi:hypothetical protein HDU96_009393 [Phlyctochytrium bullatum]|nr:hypothetical protein HDU96_009393 [Phlyctochytrium bullatum]